MYSPWEKFQFHGYLKLVRKKDEITAFISPDKEKWKQVGAVELKGMQAGILAGMATTSRNPITYVTAGYKYVEMK